MITYGRLRHHYVILLGNFLLVLYCLNASAQTPGASQPLTQRPINGRIMVAGGQPVVGGIVSLFKADSSLLETTHTDSTGYFLLKTMPPGDYHIRVTHLSLQPVFRSFQVSDSVMASGLNIEMQNQVRNLNEITVKEKRPPIEILGDRITLSLESSPVFAGGSTLDALSQAPRLSIDVGRRSIAIDGKPGIQLYVNNHQINLPADQLVAYLQAIPANSVSRAEILTNPPSRYDAGMGGVILVYTKDFYSQGITADVSASAGAGWYPKGNLSVGLSFVRGKWSGKLLYAPTYRPTFYSWTSTQELAPETGATPGFSRSSQFRKVDNASQLFRTNWSVKVSRKTTLGTVFYLNQARESQYPVSTIDYRLAIPTTALTRISSTAEHDQKRLNVSGNLNLIQEFGKPKTTLSVDVDWANYTDNAHAKATYFGDQGPLRAESLHIFYPNRIQIRTAKADFTTTLGKVVVEAGLKYSHIIMANHPLNMGLTGSFEPIKPLLLNAFDYQEQVGAVYGSVNYAWKSWSLRSGLRLERTHYAGQASDAGAVVRDYTNVFPFLNLQYSNAKKYQFSLSANRRIIRPGFDMLNPSYIFYDPITLYSGNPLLLPQLASSIQATLTTPRRISLTMAYNQNRNRLTEIIYRYDRTSPTMLNSTINFDWERRLSAILLIPVQILRNWQLQATLTGLYSHFYSSFQNRPTYTALPTGVIKAINTIKLNRWSASAILTYRTQIVVGYLTYKPLWYVDLGLQRVINDQSSVKLSATDIFQTQIITNQGQYLNTSVGFQHRLESRQVLLTYTTRFGRTKARAVQERQLGSEPEQERLRSR